MRSNEISAIVSRLTGKRRHACEALQGKVKASTFWNSVSAGRFGDAASFLLNSKGVPDATTYSDMLWEG